MKLKVGHNYCSFFASPVPYMDQPSWGYFIFFSGSYYTWHKSNILLYTFFSFSTFLLSAMFTQTSLQQNTGKNGKNHFLSFLILCFQITSFPCGFGSQMRKRQGGFVVKLHRKCLPLTSVFKKKIFLIAS